VQQDRKKDELPERLAVDVELCRRPVRRQRRQPPARGGRGTRDASRAGGCYRGHRRFCPTMHRFR
jgi:hypothetical protein